MTLMREIGTRLLLAVLLPLGQLLMAVITVPTVLFGRRDARREIERGMSRELSALWDGQGDCTFSSWSYRMLVHGKEWGPFRVKFVDWLNREPGHCLRAYAWHQAHGLLDPDSERAAGDIAPFSVPAGTYPNPG